jgi:hypothetical protein
MFLRRNWPLFAVLVVATSIAAFTPRLVRPHCNSSLRATDATTLSGSRQCIADSSGLPNLKVAGEAHRASFPNDLTPASDDQTARPSPILAFATPSERPLIRRFKLLPTRAESPDPL